MCLLLSSCSLSLDDYYLKCRTKTYVTGTYLYCDVYESDGTKHVEDTVIFKVQEEVIK